MAENRFKQKSVKPTAALPIQEPESVDEKSDVAIQEPTKPPVVEEKPKSVKKKVSKEPSQEKLESPTITTSMRLPVHIVEELDHYVARATLSGKKRTKSEVVASALTEYFANH